MKKNIIVSLLLGVFTTLPAYALTEGKDYEEMPVTIDSLPENKNKIEITEFFAYWCPHCYDLEPIISKYSKNLASDTVFRAEHVVWVKDRDFGLARLAAAVQQSGLKYRANQLIFDALVRDRINLGDPEILNKWASEQKSFNGKRLLDAYNSFNNQNMAKQMEDWTGKYGIDGTPTVVVGGKYKVKFSQGYEAGMKTIDELVEKVRQERGMKAPAAKVATKGIGLKFSHMANQ